MEKTQVLRKYIIHENLREFAKDLDEIYTDWEKNTAQHSGKI
ncbi:hypothetical protein [Candidatus Lokiarchaeum ossiferum]